MQHNAVLKSEEPVFQTPYVYVPAENSRLHRSAVNKQFSEKMRKRHLLTEREGTIIAFIGSGQTNKEIARELGVTPETIKSHLKRIFQKLSASTRAQAVARAQNIGLVEPCR